MRVAVIGGGIQGTCVAMELARRGVAVDLIEEKPKLMEGASRHSEGKVHLGYVYANDPSLRTAALMIEGAFSFASNMRRWLGPSFEDIVPSPAFLYVVHRDTVLPVERLVKRYEAISALISSRLPNGDYFGRLSPHRITRLDDSEVSSRFGPVAGAAFATEEIALDPRRLADLIVETVVGNTSIRVSTGTFVESVNRHRRTLTGREGQNARIELGPYDHVVNCAWSGRLAIDATMGLDPPGPWSFRMKYFLRATRRPDAPRLPTSTIVLGPFGELVEYADNSYYLSWYPICRRGWSSGLRPPSWASRPAPTEARTMAIDTIEALSKVFPDLRSPGFEIDDPDVRGGIIFALGNTDVDDPASQLHRRSYVGPITLDNWYHSVDTGKSTTAPLFALHTADRITGP